MKFHWKLSLTQHTCTLRQARLRHCSLWLTTWLFGYVLESDHKTDPSEKNLYVGWIVGLFLLILCPLARIMCRWTGSVMIHVRKRTECFSCSGHAENRVWQNLEFRGLRRKKLRKSASCCKDDIRCAICRIGAPWAGRDIHCTRREISVLDKHPYANLHDYLLVFKMQHWNITCTMYTCLINIQLECPKGWWSFCPITSKYPVGFIPGGFVSLEVSSQEVASHIHVYILYKV